MIGYNSLPITILLADDDIGDRFLFKDALGQIDARINLEMFESGYELMNYLSDSTSRVPNLIFLDLNMPYMNGLMCLHEIRRNTRLKEVSVIIYSTSTTLECIDKALNTGANLYFAKSSTFQDLINRLKKILEMNWDDFNPEMNREKFVLTDVVGL